MFKALFALGIISLSISAGEARQSPLFTSENDRGAGDIHATSLDASDTAVPEDAVDDENERLRQVCDREYDFCCDWCAKSKGGSACYSKCMDKYSECLKKIESRPIPKPDY